MLLPSGAYALPKKFGLFCIAGVMAAAAITFSPLPAKSESLEEAIRAAAERYFQENPTATIKTLSRDDVREVQRLLNELGYGAGPADGLPGNKTRGAARKFAQDNGLSESALNTSLLLALRGAAPQPTQSNALHSAAMIGNIGDLKSLIDSGASVDAYDEKGWTPLAHAAFNGQLAAFEMLYAASENPAKPLPDGSTPVALAAAAKHQNVLSFAMHDPDRSGMTNENASGVSAASLVLNNRSDFTAIASNVEALMDQASSVLTSQPILQRLMRTATDWAQIYPVLATAKWRKGNASRCSPLSLQIPYSPARFLETDTIDMLPSDLNAPLGNGVRVFLNFAAWDKRGFLTYRPDEGVFYLDHYIHQDGLFKKKPSTILAPCFDTAAPLSASAESRLKSSLAEARIPPLSKGQQLSTSTRFFDYAKAHHQDWPKVLSAIKTIKWRVEGTNECRAFLDLIPPRLRTNLVALEPEGLTVWESYEWEFRLDFAPYYDEILSVNTGQKFKDYLYIGISDMEARRGMTTEQINAAPSNSLTQVASLFPCYPS